MSDGHNDCYDDDDHDRDHDHDRDDDHDKDAVKSRVSGTLQWFEALLPPPIGRQFQKSEYNSDSPNPN